MPSRRSSNATAGGERGINAAEDAAAQYLARQGLRVRERNFRCRFGEIDLIAEDGNTVVFVEVRQRSSAAFGGALASINAAKQARLVRTAQFYLAQHGAEHPCRFDVVLLDGEAQMQWLRDAFQPRSGS